MTANDKQIDLLLKRYAQRAEAAMTGEHLDADEMSTFAEGALPPAARGRYISHLATCDQCRQQVTQLAVSSGAVVRAETIVADPSERGTFWQSLSALFGPRALRYAAFAAVLLVAAGVTFIALRRPQRPNEMVALRTEGEQHPPAAIQPSAGSSSGAAADANSRPLQSNSPSTTSIGSEQTGKRDADKLTEVAPAPTMMKEAPATGTTEAKKAGAESDVAKNQPAYAPPPPGEAGQPTSVAGVAAKKEPQKAEQTTGKFATAERERSQGVLNSARDDRAMKDQSLAQQRRAVDEKAKGGPSRNFENQANQANRNVNEKRVEAAPLSAPKPNDSEEAQTRSVGGRKFRKQGSAWVDQKFKSSMTLKSISRGSDEFNDLDSGLRSIAQQLGGEVIVVWKGKAYLIK